VWAALTLDVRHTLWPNERISFVGFQILMRLMLERFMEEI